MHTAGLDVARLIGIYEADGSLLGELSYVLGKLIGNRHCALCDITHGAVRKKPAFAELEARLPLPIVLLHLDERSDAVKAASEGHTPCVLLEDEKGLRVLITADELDGCGGDVACFEGLVRAATKG